MEEASNIFSELALAAQQGGAVAKLFQGKVTNDGKEAENFGSEDEHVLAIRSAKTTIDEAVQEIILLAAARCLNTDTVLADAEEKTPSLSLFPASDAETSIIIDPIDGTLEYLNGEDAYSVCIGLLDSGRVRLVIVFFPKRDVAYGIAADGVSYIYRDFGISGIARGERIVLSKTPKKVIYKSRRVSDEFANRFASAGYEVVEMGAYSEGLLRVISGEAAGYIAGNPQIRDILLGPVIAYSSNGFMCTWQGKEVIWPRSGRTSELLFGNSHLESELRACLQ